jgi:DNA repair exonuclease SbcCD ATPase subunit
VSDIVADLRRKEQQIQDLRNREQRRQGQEDQLRTQLKQGFELDTVEAAVERLNTIGEEIAQTEQGLQALNTELEQIIQIAIAPSTGGLNGSAQKP